VDCAIIGAVAKYWVDDNQYLFSAPNDHLGLYSNCSNILGAQGLSDTQVRVVLFKDANPGRPCDGNTLKAIPAGFSQCTLSLLDKDVCHLMQEMGQIARTIKTRYHNVEQMYVHSRIYGGYANPNDSFQDDPTHFQLLNPEPFAYEQGFAMKWLIQAQIDQVYLPGHPVNAVTGPLSYNDPSPNGAPWIDWGSYMWAAGTIVPCLGCPISGLTWRQDYRYEDSAKDDCNQHPGSECDFEAKSAPINGKNPPDNTHPSLCGRDKVAKMLLWSYCSTTSPTSAYMKPWLNPNTSCAAPSPPTNDCVCPTQDNVNCVPGPGGLIFPQYDLGP